MKNILILTYYYKHKNAMASVRGIKLAKYLAGEKDCNVTVLTSNQVDTWTKQYLTPTADERICEWYAPQVKRWTLIRKFIDRRGEQGRKKAAAMAAQNKETVPAPQVHRPRKKSLKARLSAFLHWLYYFNIAKQEDVCLFKGLKEEYLRQGAPYYDAVIATYPTFGALKMGIWMKKHKHCGKFIADFRDPLYNPGFREKKAEADFDLRCLKQTVNAADEIVCVSQGIADGITDEFVTLSKEKIHIITNGFDRDDVTNNEIPVAFEEGKVHFVYTGTLYHGKRCVDMLAQILKKLIGEGRLASDCCTIEYAGPDYNELLCQLRTYGLEDIARDHGFVSREMSIALQKQADALLLLTWNESSYKGVIPGKLFEYMAIGKPIIALVTGDVTESEVALILRETKAGCSCEEAAAANLSELETYLLKLFSNGEMPKSDAAKYDYAEISTRYLNLINKG